MALERLNAFDDATFRGGIEGGMAYTGPPSNGPNHYSSKPYQDHKEWLEVAAGLRAPLAPEAQGARDRETLDAWLGR